MRAGIFSFGPFQLDPERRRLIRAGEPVALPDRHIDILISSSSGYYSSGASAGSLLKLEVLLEGDLTAGYEIARATTVRLFAQVDAALPFYTVISNSYSRSGVVTTRRYAPSLVFSVGLGWQRGRH